MTLKEELKELEVKYGLVGRKSCGEAEVQRYKHLSSGETLPEGIVFDGETYWKEKSGNVTDEEIDKYVKLKNAKNIQTIKNCLIFFTTIATICLIAVAILLFIQFTGRFNF